MNKSVQKVSQEVKMSRLSSLVSRFGGIRGKLQIATHVILPGHCTNICPKPAFCTGEAEYDILQCIIIDPHVTKTSSAGENVSDKVN